MGSRWANFLAMFVGLVILLGFLGQLIHGSAIPDNAIVYLDESTKTYYAPPLVLAANAKEPGTFDPNKLKRITIFEAKKENYKPDSKSVEMGYFKEQITLTNKFLIKVGFAKPKPSRWTPDGQWYY